MVSRDITLFWRPRQGLVVFAGVAMASALCDKLPEGAWDGFLGQFR
jgi:hypothetical protein